MKLALREHTDITAGVMDEIDVTIEANGVAFFAQMSGLAKDKIGYPIRELATNAWDASVARFGDEVPEDKVPRIFLPTNLNPTFRIRDYGHSMTKQVMEDVYSRLYASTKRLSDKEAGGWGLGKMSPFAYLIGESGTGMFTITTWSEGKKRIWTMSLDQAGKPKLRMIHEEDTDEETGVEVSFSVSRNDIYAFHHRAKEIYWSFHPRPKVFPEIEWGEPKVYMKGEGWTRYHAHTVPFDGPHVQLGPVMYPFDLRQIQGSQMLNEDDAVLFEAPIGSLSVTLSREALAYDERTKATLERLVRQYETSNLEQIRAKVQAADSYFAACRIFYDETGNLGQWRQDWLHSQIKWRGLHLRAAGAELLHAKMMKVSHGGRSVEKFEGGKVDFRTLEGFKIAIEHNPYRSKERLAAAGLDDERFLWIRVKRDDLASVLTQIGNPAGYITLDDFKLEKKSPTEKRAKTVRKRRTITATQYGMHIEAEDVDLAGGGFYVYRDTEYGHGKYDANWFIGRGIRVSQGTMERFLKLAAELKVLPEDTEILIKQEKDVLTGGWTFIADKLKPLIEAKVDFSTRDEFYGRTESSLDAHVRQFVREYDLTQAPAPMKAFKEEVMPIIERLQRGTYTRTDTDRAIEALKMIGHTVQEPTFPSPTQAINDKYQAMIKKYPLFRVIADHHYGYGYDTKNKRQTALNEYFRLLACEEREQAAQAVEDAQEPIIIGA